MLPSANEGSFIRVFNIVKETYLTFNINERIIVKNI